MSREKSFGKPRVWIPPCSVNNSPGTAEELSPRSATLGKGASYEKQHWSLSRAHSPTRNIQGNSLHIFQVDRKSSPTRSLSVRNMSFISKQDSTRLRSKNHNLCQVSNPVRAQKCSRKMQQLQTRISNLERRIDNLMKKFRKLRRSSSLSNPTASDSSPSRRFHKLHASGKSMSSDRVNETSGGNLLPLAEAHSANWHFEGEVMQREWGNKKQRRRRANTLN